MGQIVSAAAKPKRCNINQLSQLGTPAAGEHILISSDNSMNAAGQGNFDCYIEGNGTDAATNLELKPIYDIDSALDDIIEVVPPILKEGYYLNIHGNFAANSEWEATDYLNIEQVKAGDIFVWKGIKYYLQACLCFYASDNTFLQAFSATGASRVITIAEGANAIGATRVKVSFLIQEDAYLLQNSVNILRKNSYYRISELDDINAAIDDVEKELHGIPEKLASDKFQQGSNDANGNVISATNRLITTDLIEMPSGSFVNIKANGQKYIILTYSTIGTFETSSGWITEDGRYDFEEAKSVRFLAAKTNDNSIAVNELAVEFVKNSNGIVGDVEELKRDYGEVVKELYGTSEKVTTSQFQRGSNDAQGNIVAATTRLITTDLIDMPAGISVNITSNGQKYVILTYSTNEVYETSSGWLTIDGTYDFQNAKKVRFVVAKTDNSSITVSELLVDFEIKLSSGIVGDIEELKKGSEGVTTKGNDSFNVFNKTIILYNPYKNKPQNAYKGQLHCHTTNSDGADSPASVVQKYIAAGYDFMTITDHNYITPNPNVSGIVWMGDSYEDTHNSAGYQHMNVFNADAVLNKSSMYQTTNTPQMIVQHFVKDGDSVVSYNHPEYPPVYASDATLEGLPIGISFVEVFNGTIQTLLGSVATASELPSEAFYGDMYDCTGDGKRYINTSTSYSSPTWSETTSSANPDGNLDRGFKIMLDAGHKVFCNAVDDYHRGDNMFNRGWMVAFAQSKTKESIWNALLNGCSYASAGVTLTELKVENGVISLEIENGSNATTTFYKEGNTVLATINGSSASYQIQGTEKYVRAMVQIGRNKAWTQPVWIIGTKNQYDF